MFRISDALMVVVSMLHVGFMVMETFLWRSKYVASAFGLSKEAIDATAPLAANQGVYNLFLAAGLIFALAHRSSDLFVPIATFFLVCIAVAGVFGAVTVSSRIVVIQAFPALAALAALRLGQ